MEYVYSKFHLNLSYDSCVEARGHTDFQFRYNYFMLDEESVSCPSLF
jgi:hypothetical protein